MAASEKLSDKQRVFVSQYLEHFNSAKAAKEAGYSENRAAKTGFDLLQLPKIQAAIQRGTKAKAKRSDIKADEIVETLANIIRADVRDVVEWGMAEVEGEDGLPVTLPNGEAVQRPYITVTNSRDLPKHISAAVAEVSMSDKGTFKVKMHDKGAAIEKIMRHLGMFEKDNRQVADGLADLIAAAQGTTIPIASRNAPERDEGGDE